MKKNFFYLLFEIMITCLIYYIINKIPIFAVLKYMLVWQKTQWALSCLEDWNKK